MRHAGNSGHGRHRGEVAMGGRGHLERAHEGQDIGLRGKYTECGGWAKRKVFWLTVRVRNSNTCRRVRGSTLCFRSFFALVLTSP